MQTRDEQVNEPKHYQFGKMEAWDVIEAAIMDLPDTITAYHVASAIKYLLRASRKGGDTDVAKAKAHLKREVARHLPKSPDYDPASVAFRHGELDKVCGVPRVGRNLPRAAYEIAHAEGAGEYGNPVTPGCAPWKLP